MKPRERRETGQSDLFKARLDQIIDMGHARVRLAQRIDWGFLEQQFGAVYTDGPGSPPLPTRLMAGLHILKYSENLSDERLCEIWAENPYFQYFCGEEFFQHTLVFDRSSLTRWRQRMGEETAHGADPGKPRGCGEDRGAEAVRAYGRGGGHDRAAQERGSSNGRKAFEPRPGAARPARQKARRRLAAVLCQGWQARAHQAAALRPCEAVQAREQMLDERSRPILAA